jgi:hypothetical protein
MTARITARNGFIWGLSWTAVFALVVVYAPIAFAIDWDFESVDATGNVWQGNSLALDASGRAHIGYIGDGEGLKYAHKPAFGWLIETVDPEGLEGYTSIAMDEAGFPHISYIGPGTDPTQNLFLASKDASGWQIQDVSYGPNLESPSLALDAEEDPHIAWVAHPLNGHDSVQYCFWDGSDWQGECVEVGSYLFSGGKKMLAIDGSGFPHVSYAKDDTLKYAHKDMSGWQHDVVDTEVEWSDPSLALDGDGYPHIAFTKNVEGYFPYTVLWYRYKDESGWHIEYVAGQMLWSAHSPCLALDSQGYPHISFREFFYGAGEWIAYAYKDASGWHAGAYFGGLGGPDALGADPSLCLDTNDIPNITYYGCANGDLKYARPTIVLSGTVEAGELVLTWSDWPWAWAYRVHGEENRAYFVPTPENLKAHVQTQTWSSPEGIGDPNSNWTYIVLGLDDQLNEILRSNYVGEHDFFTLIP